MDGIFSVLDPIRLQQPREALALLVRLQLTCKVSLYCALSHILLTVSVYCVYHTRLPCFLIRKTVAVEGMLRQAGTLRYLALSRAGDL